MAEAPGRASASRLATEGAGAAAGGVGGPSRRAPWKPVRPPPRPRRAPSAPNLPGDKGIRLPANRQRISIPGVGRTGWLIPAWLLAAATTASISGVYLGVPWVTYAGHALLLGVAAAWAALGGRPSLPRTVGHAAWAFLIVLAGSAVASTEPAASLDGLTRAVVCLALLCLASALPPGGLAWRQQINVILLAGVLTFAAAAYFFWAGGTDMHGLFGNKNHFAGYLLLCLPLSLSCLLAATAPRDKLAYGAATALFAAGLLLSQSRGAWAALLPALAIVMAAHWRRPESWQKATAVGALALALALAMNAGALAGTVPAGAAAVQDIAASISGAPPPGTLGPRLEYWEGALRIASVRPWLGAGPSTFAAAYPAYLPDLLHYSRYAHQLLLQALAETGVLGLMALLALLVTAGLAAATRLRPSVETSDAFEKACLTGLAAGLIASLLHNMVELDWHVPAITVVASIQTGLLLSGPATRGTSRDATPEVTLLGPEARANAAAGMIVCLAGLAWAALRLSGQQLEARGVAAREAGDLARAAAVFETAALLDPLSAAPFKSLAALSLQRAGEAAPISPERGVEAASRAVELAALDVEARFLLAQAYLQRGIPGDSTLALLELERAAALRHASLAPAVHAALGRAYLQASRLQDAEAAYRRLVDAMAGTPPGAEAAAFLAEAHVVLGNIAAGRGEPDTALASYRQALRESPGYTPAHFNLGVLLLDRGAPVEAADALRRAIALGPDQALFHYYLGRALAESGDLRSARAEWERALAMEPGCEACRVELRRTASP